MDHETDATPVTIKTDAMELYAPTWAAAGQLQRKIGAVSAALRPLALDGVNEEEGYTFSTYAQLVTQMKAALAEAKLTLTVAAKDMARNGQARQVRIEGWMSDEETGAVQICRWLGEAWAPSDKGTAWALSRAVKHMWMRQFAVTSADEPDPDAAKHVSPQSAPAAPASAPEPDVFAAPTPAAEQAPANEQPQPAPEPPKPPQVAVTAATATFADWRPMAQKRFNEALRTIGLVGAPLLAELGVEDGVAWQATESEGEALRHLMLYGVQQKALSIAQLKAALGVALLGQGAQVAVPEGRKRIDAYASKLSKGA